MIVGTTKQSLFYNLFPSPCEAPETATADCSSGAVAETAEDLFGAAFFEVWVLWKGSMCHVFFMIPHDFQFFPRKED
jgi:hypothetical protein